MRLLVDIGNTRVKWLLIEETAKIPLTVQTQPVTHHQKFPLAIQTCFGGGEFEQLLSAFSLTKPDDVWVSNVAGEQAKQAMSEFANLNWQVETHFVDVHKEQVGIYNSYEVLTELGVDRWLAVLGARQIFPAGNVVVINCGTAITVDVLNVENCFMGGAILPGFQLAASALSRTDGIETIKPNAIAKPMGVRTSECVQLGVISACVGGVEFMVEKIQQELDSKFVNILLSGGAAELFLSATQLECEYDANVIMRGLNRIIECE